eukprot:gene17551-biopygen13247
MPTKPHVDMPTKTYVEVNGVPAKPYVEMLTKPYVDMPWAYRHSRADARAAAGAPEAVRRPPRGLRMQRCAAARAPRRVIAIVSLGGVPISGVHPGFLRHSRRGHVPDAEHHFPVGGWVGFRKPTGPDPCRPLPRIRRPAPAAGGPPRPADGGCAERRRGAAAAVRARRGGRMAAPPRVRWGVRRGPPPQRAAGLRAAVVATCQLTPTPPPSRRRRHPVEPQLLHPIRRPRHMLPEIENKSETRTARITEAGERESKARIKSENQKGRITDVRERESKSENQKARAQNTEHRAHAFLARRPELELHGMMETP